eukprot:2083332-Amphidinium_carterae.1
MCDDITVRCPRGTQPAPFRMLQVADGVKAIVAMCTETSVPPDQTNGWDKSRLRASSLHKLCRVLLLSPRQ